jgi:hypothetical protein
MQQVMDSVVVAEKVAGAVIAVDVAVKPEGHSETQPSVLKFPTK